MTDSFFLFGDYTEDKVSGVAFKNLILKKEIIQYLDQKGSATINEISSQINSSPPKTNDLVQELMEHEVLIDLGKNETTVGRRPQLYGLNSDSLYFLGVDVQNNKVEMGLLNFREELVEIDSFAFDLENNKASLHALCELINTFLDRNPSWRKKTVRVGVNLSGRVNYHTGYSHNYFNFLDQPLSKTFKQKIGIITTIENDTRARAYGEFHNLKLKGRSNILYVYADYGVGLGVMIDGQLHYGKSGYSGEFGHIPFFNNEIICRCGKKGCLETEASGRALIMDFKRKLESGSSSLVTKNKPVEKLLMEDIIQAANADDTLAIELVSIIGSKLGRAVSTLIHLYNPELIVFGGALTKTGDHFFLPLQMAINKYSIQLVRNDTALVISENRSGEGVLGACLLSKDRVLNAV